MFSLLWLAVALLLLGTSHTTTDQYLLLAGPTAANPTHAAAVVNSWDRPTG